MVQAKVGPNSIRSTRIDRTHQATAAPATTAACLAQLTRLRPKLAIVLGSGFHDVCSRLRVVDEISYRKLPGFAQPSVGGHEGRMLLGSFANQAVCLLSGRLHYYEGHPMEVITFPIRVLAQFGVQTLLLTNAAGGIHRRFVPGDFMRLTDHVNWMGANPLRGLQAVQPAQRFVDLTHTYDPLLGKLLQRAAKHAGATLHAGVYLAVSGPSYETPAEIRAFARLGADAVGMSTVPEAIVARQCGLRVAGLSCITNRAAGRGNTLLSHADVIRTGLRVRETAAGLIEEFVRLHETGN